MKIIQKSKYASGRLNNILKAYGGRYTFKEALKLGGIGVGGMRYLSGVDMVDELRKRKDPKSVIEILRNGINFHVLVGEDSVWIMYKFEEILSVIIEKPADQIFRKEGFTFFNYFIKKGMVYPWARVFLLEDEIGELHDPTINLTTIVGETLSLKITRKNYLKVIQFFQNSPLADKLEVEVKDY